MRKKNILWLSASLFLLVFTASCSGVTPTISPSTSPTAVKVEPVLSDVLINGCANPMDFANDQTGLAAGTKARNFTLKDISGNEVHLSRLLAEKPVVMVFGSYSDSNVRAHLIASEEVYARYKDRFNFIMVYVIEEYPVGSASPYDPKGLPFITDSSYTESGEGGLPIQQPKTYEQRLKQANACVTALHITIPMLVDEIENPVWCTFGPASNIAYFIDRDGTILFKLPYYVPDQMAAELDKYLAGK